MRRFKPKKLYDKENLLCGHCVINADFLRMQWLELPETICRQYEET
jgi:hypothetical protein